ncbi:tyrosine-type recombinase/integrase [Embleya sp. NBC_00896]|uniref:tyrosine-type recombinase/integrase n=1 Tax=Embleya sp. NBC_00896 TaxID=2975961 RepID=UPI00386B4119
MERGLGARRVVCGLWCGSSLGTPCHQEAEQIHSNEFSGKEPDAILFLGPRGGLIRRNNFDRVWKRLCKIRTKDVHFHDLRHTGNTLAASTGARLWELTARMGQSSTGAALIYRHTRRTGQREHRRGECRDPNGKEAGRCGEPARSPARNRVKKPASERTDHDWTAGTIWCGSGAHPHKSAGTTKAQIREPASDLGLYLWSG